MRLKVGSCEVVLTEGDITEFEGNAIVNAANSLMIMGGGVAGAIKRKGGEEIEREAVEKAPVPVGEAIATSAGKLKVKYVIHAPTMERPAMRVPPENAYLATKAALKVAKELGLKKVAFPMMGAGVGGLSVGTAAKEMLKAIKESCEGMEVWLYAYGEKAYEELLRAAREFAEGGS
ncbi:macro domain-containing protein [Ignicoccus hospitalis]|uniref:Appr-1-p processing domain protein n=1 Tax=Ignicoccus hospitalis (strain KIN4/I / DSM 18386 / JCM 14125) TaxID=453591 RepID=A8A9L9_IGNH4|nr:macro domain-containing protein [Ignicoccus hospitalis]ABU81621.1 Appr-1-p processing domain protein [Ignicoccus hospitalis KIN4/I]